MRSWEIHRFLEAKVFRQILAIPLATGWRRVIQVALEAPISSPIFFVAPSVLLGAVVSFGLIATNTIGQGDTRDTGLAAILENGGTIIRAMRRLRWPGEAAVVVSVVHVAKHRIGSDSIWMVGQLAVFPLILSRATSTTPQRNLLQTSGMRFRVRLCSAWASLSMIRQRSTALRSSLDEMHRLIQKDERNGRIIFPYIGGEEISTDPCHKHHRYAIDFFDRPLGRRDSFKPWKQMTSSEQAECLTCGLVPQTILVKSQRTCPIFSK